MCKAIQPLIGRRYELGHERIDSDHKEIADWWLRIVNCEPIQYPFYIARLKKLMRSHFDHEAALLAGAGSALCDCHHQEHQALLDLCDQAIALSRADWRRSQLILRNRLPKLVREHIISMDQFAVLYLNTRGDDQN
jgi:hemerythrin